MALFRSKKKDVLFLATIQMLRCKTYASKETYVQPHVGILHMILLHCWSTGTDILTLEKHVSEETEGSRISNIQFLYTLTGTIFNLGVCPLLATKLFYFNVPSLVILQFCNHPPHTKINIKPRK